MKLHRVKMSEFHLSLLGKNLLICWEFHLLGSEPKVGQSRTTIVGSLSLLSNLLITNKSLYGHGGSFIVYLLDHARSESILWNFFGSLKFLNQIPIDRPVVQCLKFSSRVAILLMWQWRIHVGVVKQQTLPNVNNSHTWLLLFVRTQSLAERAKASSLPNCSWEAEKSVVKLFYSTKSRLVRKSFPVTD